MHYNLELAEGRDRCFANRHSSSYAYTIRRHNQNITSMPERAIRAVSLLANQLLTVDSHEADSQMRKSWALGFSIASG